MLLMLESQFLFPLHFDLPPVIEDAVGFLGILEIIGFAIAGLIFAFTSTLISKGVRIWQIILNIGNTLFILSIGFYLYAAALVNASESGSGGFLIVIFVLPLILFAAAIVVLGIIGLSIAESMTKREIQNAGNSISYR